MKQRLGLETGTRVGRWFLCTRLVRRVVGCVTYYNPVMYSPTSPSAQKTTTTKDYLAHEARTMRDLYTHNNEVRASPPSITKLTLFLGGGASLMQQ